MGPRDTQVTTNTTASKHDSIVLTEHRLLTATHRVAWRAQPWTMRTDLNATAIAIILAEYIIESQHSKGLAAATSFFQWTQASHWERPQLLFNISAAGSCSCSRLRADFPGGPEPQGAAAHSSQRQGGCEQASRCYWCRVTRHAQATSLHNPRCFAASLYNDYQHHIIGFQVRPVRWLTMESHFFIRPHYSQLVMVDLDGFGPLTDRLLRLKPRAVVETSPGSLQLWVTLSSRHAAKDALTVTRELTAALAGDPACVRTTQVGRLPGSINQKPGKMNRVKLLFAQMQDMCEETFLRETAPRPCSVPKTEDKSASDWQMVCEFFEQNPDASAQTALLELAGTFAAQRPNQVRIGSLVIAAGWLRLRDMILVMRMWRSATARGCAGLPAYIRSQITGRVVAQMKLSTFCNKFQHPGKYFRPVPDTFQTNRHSWIFNC